MVKKSNRSTVGTTILMLIMAGFVLFGFYAILTSNGSDQQKEKTEVEKLIEKDITNNYPATPKEVVKLYARITKCLYKEEFTSEQFEQLTGKIWDMFDDELQSSNPKETFAANIQEEINAYKEEEKTISGYEVQSRDETDFKKIDGEEFATLVLMFRTRSSSAGVQKVYERFLLRADSAGCWRIAGWKQIDEIEIDD